MDFQDLEQLATNEKKVMESQDINRIRDIPDFPFASLAEVRAAKAAGDITFGVLYDPDAVKSLGTRRDVIAQYVWLAWTPMIGAAFIVAALVTGQFVLFWGVLTTVIGFFASSPAFQRLLGPLVGLAWVFCIYLALAGSVWAWTIGGLYGGYIFASTARLQATMVLEQGALTSEVFFCYLYLSRILIVRENNQNSVI